MAIPLLLATLVRPLAARLGRMTSAARPRDVEDVRFSKHSVPIRDYRFFLQGLGSLINPLNLKRAPFFNLG